MIVTNPEIDTPVLHLVGEEADRLGLECFVIGGWVRDLFLHRRSDDIDIVVVGREPKSMTQQSEAEHPHRSGIGIQLAEAVAKRLGRGAHLSVFKTYGTAQVKRGDVELEFVGARRESYHHDSRNPIVEDGTLEEDQNRRDFTINAMAVCLNTECYGELLDPFDGIGDLERCIIRTPLNPDITFSDDPLRMMRAIRFAAQLGFNLDAETFVSIGRNRERIAIITRERIAEELNKIMLSHRPSEGWILLDKTGLLPLVFPELAALKGVEVKDGRGHKDVFYHTLQVLDNVAELQSDSPKDGLTSNSEAVLIPMIDARRMEVYTTGADGSPRAVVVESEESLLTPSLSGEGREGAFFFYFGDGAAKCRSVLTSPNWHYIPDIVPEARFVASCLATISGPSRTITDLAYYEPFYLKDFVAAPSHVKGLR